MSHPWIRRREQLRPPARRCRLLAIVLLPLCLGASAARADRLPLARGGWIETLGPWRLEGRRVVYRSTEGNLRSIQLRETALAAGSREPAERLDGSAVLEYPLGRAVTIPAPAPLPAPAPPPLARRPAPPAPVACVLANASPGEAPEVLCVGGRDAAPPAPETAAADPIR